LAHRHDRKLPVWEIWLEFSDPSLGRLSGGKLLQGSWLGCRWLTGPSLEDHERSLLQDRPAKTIEGGAAARSEGRGNLGCRLADDPVIDTAEPAAWAGRISNQVATGAIGSAGPLTPATGRVAAAIAAIHTGRTDHFFLFLFCFAFAFAFS